VEVKNDEAKRALNPKSKTQNPKSNTQNSKSNTLVIVGTAGAETDVE
jgi:hypothetical protein